MSHLLKGFEYLCSAEFGKYNDLEHQEEYLHFNNDDFWVEAIFEFFSIPCSITLPKRSKDPLWKGQYVLSVRNHQIDCYHDLSEALEYAKEISLMFYGALASGIDEPNPSDCWYQLNTLRVSNRSGRSSIELRYLPTGDIGDVESAP